MESIISKLKFSSDLDTMSMEEQKMLLEMYHIISKNETKIFDLIYKYHGDDSYEDIFRDYCPASSEDRTKGAQIALERVKEIIDETAEDIANAQAAAAEEN